MPQQQRSSVPTIEANNKALSAALLGGLLKPGAAAERRIAREYRTLGILDAAADHLTRALQFNPADGAAYEGLAQIWRDWGFANIGLGDAQRAVYFSPASPSAHNTHGTLLAALGQQTAARQAYTRALALDPDAAYVLNNLCALSLDQDDAAQAMRECAAALSINPDLRMAQANLARAKAVVER